MKYLFMPQGLEVLREERFGSRSRQFRRLADQCQLYEKENLPKEHPLKSITYYGMAAANLALMYKLTGQKRYLAEARRWIFAGVDYPHWGKAVKVDVDLSAAWLLFGYGLCYNWLRDDLTLPDRQTLLEKLILQGQRMYQYAVDTGFDAIQREQQIENAEGKTIDVLTGRSWATTYWQNHNWIDFTGLAMAGYAIAEDYPKAHIWTDLARENFHRVLPLLPEDGSDYEGVVYWRYGVIWLFHYAQLLRETEGEDLFAKSDFLRNTFWYRLYQMAPDQEQNFNHGDCHDRRSGHIPCLYYKAASEYRNGYAQYLAEQVLEHTLFREGYQSGVKPGILPEAFLEYLWYDPTVEPVSLEALPKLRYFEDLGLVSFRTGWDKDATAFSFKCSPGGGKKQWKLTNLLELDKGIRTRSMGHHHPDASSFMLIRGGDFLAVDDGYSSRKMARHHNLILVDGKGFAGDGAYDVYASLKEEQTAEILEFSPKGKGFYLCAESAGLYHPSLRLNMMRREIVNTGKGWFLILDTVSSDKEHTYTWLLHADQMPMRKDTYYRFENAGSAMEVRPGDLELRFGTTLMTVSANVTSQEPDNMVYTRLHTLCEENKMPQKEIVFLNLITTGSAEDGGCMPATVRQTDDGWEIIAGDDQITVNLSADADDRFAVQTAEGDRWTIHPSNI